MTLAAGVLEREGVEELVGFETLEGLIRPHAARDFLDRFWGKSHLRIEGEKGRFEHLFDLKSIDSWLASVRDGMADSVIIASPEGADVESQRFRPQQVSPDHAFEAFFGGSSIVLNHLEDWPSIVDLAKGLGKEFCADVGVNAYLTPVGARTFPVHADNHDVIILQIHGAKAWSVRELRLAQVDLTYKKRLNFSEEWYGRMEAPLLDEFCLTPGDVLYIPRGMPHCASAVDTASLHLTISITPLYWLDFLKAGVEQASIHSAKLRESLPPGFVASPGAAVAMRDDFKRAVEELIGHMSFEEILSAVKRSRVAFQGLPRDGRFERYLDDADLSAGSRLVRRKNLLCASGEHFDRQGNRKVAIWYGDRFISGPPKLRPALDFICANEEFAVRDIPGLDEKGQLVLAKRLVNEGMMRVAKESDPYQ